MKLSDAIAIVVAHTREGQGNDVAAGSDYDILQSVYNDETIDQDEISSWVESELIGPGDTEDAYRMVLAASRSEIEAAVQRS